MRRAETGQSFATLLAAHPMIIPHLDTLDLGRLLDPSGYRGESAAMVDALAPAVDLP